MKNKITISLLLLAATITFATGPSLKRDPLKKLLGHWEGTAKFADTKYSKARGIQSKTDCNWTPQGTALVCETTIRDTDGEHKQLSVDTADDGGKFTYYTITEGNKPYAGALTIKDTNWVYGPSPEGANTFPVFRTTNNFTGDTEEFKTEFTEDGTHWTTMLEGTMRRTAPPPE